MHRTIRRTLAILALPMFLIAIGCVEQSVVVKVQKRGSAIIHIRSFTMPDPFRKRVREKGASIGVDDKTVAELLENLGKGVSVQSNSKAANSRGWPGTELVLFCENVNSLEITTETLELIIQCLSGEPMGKQSTDQRSQNMAPSPRLRSTVKFAFDNETLVIERSTEQPVFEPSDRNGARDPFAKPDAVSGISSSVFFANVIRHVRLGLYVEAEQEITGADATYPVKNNQVTFYELDGSRIDATEYMAFVSANPTTIEESKPWIDKLDGLSIETKARVQIELR